MNADQEDQKPTTGDAENSKNKILEQGERKAARNML
jgi:hypothetical protein